MHRREPNADAEVVSHDRNVADKVFGRVSVVKTGSDGTRFAFVDVGVGVSVFAHASAWEWHGFARGDAVVVPAEDDGGSSSSLGRSRRNSLRAAFIATLVGAIRSTGS